MNPSVNSDNSNAYGFYDAQGRQCEIRVYENDHVLTYEVYRDSERVVDRKRVPSQESEKELVARLIKMMNPGSDPLD